jgi:hypothetical protein
VRRKRPCDDRPIAHRRPIVASLAVPVVALLVVCLLQARDHLDTAPGGAGNAALALQLAAGLALVAGAVAVARRGEALVAGALLAGAAGLALRALPAPPDGALLFTLGLAGAGLAPVAVAHAALAYPSGRLNGWVDRAAVAIGYGVSVGLAGVLVALVLDPRRGGCFACPRNLLLVHADPGTADWLARWGALAAAVVDTGLAALILARLARRPAAARSIAAPVSVATVGVLLATGVADLRAASGLAADATDRDLWLVVAGALALVAIGLTWRPVRAARVRAALGRLTVAASAGPEALRAALARASGDPRMAIVVPHPETGAPLTLDGTAAPPSRARTPVERQGRLVAWLDHASDTVVPPEIARPAALTLEREALLATQRLQAAEVRASTFRLVEAGDSERRRLERNLHDGAQQRLLGLGLALERARAGAAHEELAALDDAHTRIAGLRHDLRHIAHGIHSVTLAEGGLAEAVLSLVDAADGRVAVDALPAERAGAAAEAAMYRLVVAILRLGRPIRLAIETAGGDLRTLVAVDGADAAELNEALAHAGARLAALGGDLEVSDATARARVPR